jgi:hypothetical protein
VIHKWRQIVPFNEPLDHATGDIERRGEEERRQDLDAKNRHGGEHVPSRDRNNRHQQL